MDLKFLLEYILCWFSQMNTLFWIIPSKSQFGVVPAYQRIYMNEKIQNPTKIWLFWHLCLGLFFLIKTSLDRFEQYYCCGIFSRCFIVAKDQRLGLIFFVCKNFESAASIIHTSLLIIVCCPFNVYICVLTSSSSSSVHVFFARSTSVRSFPTAFRPTIKPFWNKQTFSLSLSLFPSIFFCFGHFPLFSFPSRS